MVSANSAASAPTVTTAAPQARLRTAPASSSTGHTFSSTARPVSAPITRGRRTPATSAATATAVTITS